MDLEEQLIVLAVTLIVLVLTAYFANRSANRTLLAKSALFGLAAACPGFVHGLFSSPIIGVSRYRLALMAADGSMPWLGMAVDWLAQAATMGGVLGMALGILFAVAYVFARGKDHGA